MFKRKFWAGAAERAIKTAAQTMVLFLGADAVDAFAVDYSRAAGITLGAAVLSILTSVASAAATDGSPSLAGESL